MKQRVKHSQKHKLTDGKSREDASQAAGLFYKQTDNGVEQKTDYTKLSILQLEFEFSEEIIGRGFFNVIVEEGQTGEGAHQTGRRLSATQTSLSALSTRFLPDDRVPRMHMIVFRSKAKDSLHLIHAIVVAYDKSVSPRKAASLLRKRSQSGPTAPLVVNTKRL